MRMWVEVICLANNNAANIFFKDPRELATATWYYYILWHRNEIASRPVGYSSILDWIIIQYTCADVLAGTVPG